MIEKNKIILSSAIAVLIAAGTGIALGVPAQAQDSSTTAPTQTTVTGVEDGTNDGETADDQGVEDGTNDGETADDQEVEDGTADGETADD